MKYTIGDTLYAIAAILAHENGDPIDVAASTVKFMLKDSSGTAVVAATESNVSKQPTKDFTASVTTDRLTCNGHGVQAGWQIIVSNSGGGLPTGLSASTRYFARDVTPNSFKVSLEPDGAAIDITGAGTGTHSFYVVGHVQYDMQSDDVDTAGLYHYYFLITSGAEVGTFPKDGATAVNLLELVAAS